MKLKEKLKIQYKMTIRKNYKSLKILMLKSIRVVLIVNILET